MPYPIEIKTTRHPVGADGTTRYRFTFEVSLDSTISVTHPDLGRMFTDALLDSLRAAMHLDGPPKAPKHPPREIVKFMNAGMQRLITFDLMRECRRWIFSNIGAQPTEIRCNHATMMTYAKLFPDWERMQWQASVHRTCSWDGIPMLEYPDIPSGELRWYRDESGHERGNAQLVGLIGDILIPSDDTTTER